MYLGRTGCAADTITAGTSTHQDDYIARIGSLTDDIFARSCCHNSTDLHTFCHIIWMINLFYIAGSKTDLVTVGAVAMCCILYDALLRKFAVQCLRHRTGRISRTGHTHSLIYIGTSGKRVTDSTA